MPLHCHGGRDWCAAASLPIRPSPKRREPNTACIETACTRSDETILRMNCSYEQMFQHEMELPEADRMDFVIIATPTSTHYKIAYQALTVFLSNAAFH